MPCTLVIDLEGWKLSGNQSTGGLLQICICLLPFWVSLIKYQPREYLKDMKQIWQKTKIELLPV